MHRFAPFHRGTYIKWVGRFSQITGWFLDPLVLYHHADNCNVDRFISTDFFASLCS